MSGGNSYARGCVRRRGARRFGGHTKRTKKIAKDGHMVEAISTGVQERGQDRTWTVVQPVRRSEGEVQNDNVFLAARVGASG